MDGIVGFGRGIGGGGGSKKKGTIAEALGRQRQREDKTGLFRVREDCGRQT